MAVIATFGVGLVLSLWLGEQYTPTTAFALLGTIITGAILPIYIAVNIACISYFWRERRREFNVIKHLVFPLLGHATWHAYRAVRGDHSGEESERMFIQPA